MCSDAITALTKQAQQDVARLSYPSRRWTLPRQYNGQGVQDVVVIGGGQSGISTAFGLQREAVDKVLILEQKPAGLAGPWIDFARMHTLRTPKTVSGPELGVPSLLVQSWYEANYGAQAWADLTKISRQDWQAYLVWLADVLQSPIRHGVTVSDIGPVDGGAQDPEAILRIDLFDTLTGGTLDPVFARAVVLANGIEGAGNWTIPAQITTALPQHLYAHTSQAIDFAALKGKRVVVLGAGASAFDNAATALEAGAGAVTLLARRKELPAVNPYRWMEFSGFLRHFAQLPDLMKWRYMRRIFEMNQPPPQDTYDRCARHGQFALITGAPVDAIAMQGEDIVLQTPQGNIRADFLIIGTGFAIDFSARPELRQMAGKVALWGDRFTPPKGEENRQLASFPWLDDGFALQEKTAGTAPWLNQIYCYTFAAMPSLACSAGISALKFGMDRLVGSITRQLFVNDADQHLQSLLAYDEIELRLNPISQERHDTAAQ